MEAGILLQIVLLGFSLYLAFFKSYLREKGKSAALKEDIQELTREVEIVKIEFTKENEILKSNLQRIISNEISYRNEERSALIEYHGIINEWLYSILEVGFGNFNKTNVNSLIEVRKRNASFYSKAGISKSRISLLVEDRELVSSADDLYMSTMNFHFWADMEYLKLMQNLNAQNSLTERFMIVIKNLEGNKELADKMANRETALLQEIKELYENYMKFRNIENAKVFPAQNRYEILVKGYLKK